MLQRISLAFFSLLATSLTLLAQASPEPVNSPQRGTTYNESVETADGGGMTLIIIGAVVVALVVGLLFLRKKNTPTVNRLHKY